MANILKNIEQFPIGRTSNPIFNFHKAMNEIMNDFYNVFESPESWESLERLNLLPAMDFTENTDSFDIFFEMPGLKEEDIDVSLDENRLHIKGEKTTSFKKEGTNFINREIRYGKYERYIDLPSAAEIDKASASFNKGVLCIHLPKKESSKFHSKKLKIQKLQ